MKNRLVVACSALGEALELAYHEAAYAEDSFAALAEEHLQRWRLHEMFDIAELAEWVVRSRSLPQQHDIDGAFGDPPVSIWSGRRFFISVLIWRSSTTSIHQHAFSGAFQVLMGSSVHTRYLFRQERKVSEDFLLGALECTSIERLERGTVRRISAGTEGIHSLFHLEHPSASLVVRTYTDARHPVQHTYFPPGIGCWDLRGEPEQRRARQVIRMLLDVDPSGAAALLERALADLVDFDAFALLEEARVVGQLPIALKALAQSGLAMDQATNEAMADALREQERLTKVKRRRDAVRDPDLRFLLAILCNAPSRKHAVALAEAQWSGRPGSESLVEWLAELSKVTIKLQAGGLPWEPNPFGLPAPDAASIEALRAHLAGSQAAGSDQATPFLDAVRRAPAFAVLFREG